MTIIEVKKIPKSPTKNSVFSIDSNGSSNAFTHDLFRYPCKFIPEIPNWAIREYLDGGDGNLLDPFNGSGTTCLEGVLRGVNSYGVEIDPLAKIISEVKTHKYSEKDFSNIGLFIKNLTSIKDAEECIIPELINIDHWFLPEIKNNLGKIRYGIEGIEDEFIKKFFLVCLASIVRKVSNADLQSPKPYVSSKHKRDHSKTDVWKIFEVKSKKYLDSIKKTSKEVKADFNLIGSDARNFSSSIKFDLAITSPPYINAFDYVRTLRLENLWIGSQTENSLKDIRENNVGTEYLKAQSKTRSTLMCDFNLEELLKKTDEIRKTDKKRADVVEKYFFDMGSNLKCVYDVLKEGGFYVMVVGDSTIRGVDIKTTEHLISIAKSIGFDLDNLFSYVIKNRYLRIPRNGQGGIIKYDNIICLIKRNGKNI